MLAREDDGRVLFVRDALPAEVVEVSIGDAKPKFAWARVTRVVEASPDRVEEPCARRRQGCGGCDWMHVATMRQLDHKSSIVLDALRRIARLEPAVSLGGSVPANAYRTTIRAVGDHEGRLGFRAQRSHDVVHAGGCLIAHPALVDLIDCVTVTPGLELTLRVSESTGELIARWDRAAGTVEGLPGRTQTGRSAAIHELVAGVSLRVSGRSFFQSGPAAAELLVETVATLCPELSVARTVVDAYCGVGVFGRCAAPTSAAVLAIESSTAAAGDVSVNCPAASVHIGDVARREALQFVRRHSDYVDVVIADPSRQGLGRRAADNVAQLGAPVIALVSCDPVSMARDAVLLDQHGYHLERVVVVDLFPNTHHVETVARFVGGK